MYITGSASLMCLQNSPTLICDVFSHPTPHQRFGYSDCFEKAMQRLEATAVDTELQTAGFGKLSMPGIPTCYWNRVSRCRDCRAAKYATESRSNSGSNNVKNTVSFPACTGGACSC